MVTILIIFLVGSFLASLFVISAGMLSSRLGQSQMTAEEYETVLVQQSSRNFRRTRPMEMNA